MVITKKTLITIVLTVMFVISSVQSHTTSDDISAIQSHTTSDDITSMVFVICFFFLNII